MKQRLDRHKAKREPHLVWNAFVDLIGMEHDSSFSPIQKQASLVFWYDSEVQNGGHGRIFRKSEGFSVCKKLSTHFKKLNMSNQAEILARSTMRITNESSKKDWTDIFNSAFIEELDKDFFQCKPDIMDALEEHLMCHQEEYIEWC